MERRRIWEIGCFGMDAILSTSFDADELVNIDGRFKAAREIPDHPRIQVPYDVLVYGMAHHACHSDNPTARLIERRLNAMHARTIESLETECAVEALADCYWSTAKSPDEVPGFIWAVLSDPRRELKGHGRFWLQGLMIQAMRDWMVKLRAYPSEREGV